MNRQFFILFPLVMVLALHGALSGCARKAAAPVQAPAMYEMPEARTGQIDARKAAAPPPGGFVYHGSTPSRSPIDDRDPLWHRYVPRGQAFVNCPPGYTYAPAVASSTPSSTKKTTRKAKPKQAARKPVAVQPALVDDAVCPPGCVPISRVNPAVVVPWSGPSAPTTSVAPASSTPGGLAPLPSVSISGTPALPTTVPPGAPAATGTPGTPTPAPAAPAR